MGHKFEAKNKHKLDSEERRKILPPQETLLKAGLQQGDIMADVGCGVGYFSIPAAGIVGPAGKVYAMDILPEMLVEVENRTSESSPGNITTVLTEENNLKLADESVSFAFISNVLHEAVNTTEFLSEVKRILAGDGCLAVVEWNKAESSFGPPLNHRLAREYVVELLQNIGLKDVRSLELGEHFYAVTGHK